jgi:hypothetical protein
LGPAARGLGGGRAAGNGGGSRPERPQARTPDRGAGIMSQDLQRRVPPLTADTPSRRARRTSSLPEVNEAPYLLETLHLQWVEWLEMIPLIRSAYTSYKASAALMSAKRIHAEGAVDQ